MVSSLSSAPPPLCLDACPGALCLVGWGLALPCSGGESLTAGTGGGPCWAGWCAPFPAWGLCLLGWPLPHSFPQMQGIPASCSAAGPEPVGTPPRSPVLSPVPPPEGDDGRSPATISSRPCKTQVSGALLPGLSLLTDRRGRREPGGLPVVELF